MAVDAREAVLAGVLQGVLEWLPVSSEGQVSILLSALGGVSPESAVRLSLVLHFGTGLSALLYYRDEVRPLAEQAAAWSWSGAWRSDVAEASFLVVATAVTGLVGIGALAALAEVVSAFTGGAFIVAVGVLLILTGVFQRAAASANVPSDRPPNLVDALLVGGLQGLAVLPGVSRSGTTVGGLLLRGHDGPASFRLSFLLSIPASLGGAVLIGLRGGLPAVGLAAAVAAVAASALVGYVTIDALLRVVAKVPFWLVCAGLGLLAVVGGGALLWA
jgi:undecaprenyl-diphosphatase